MRHRESAHEFGAQFLVRRKSAGRQDHAAARARMVWRFGPMSTTAPSTRSLSLHQLDQARIEYDRHVARLETVEQPRDQRVAHDQARAARKAQPVGRVAQQQLRGGQERPPRAERLQQDRDVVLADHHAAEHHEGRDRRAHAREILAQQASVERQRRERAAGERAPRLVGVIVRVARRRAELHLGARLEIVERGRACGEKCLAHAFRARTDLGGEEPPRIVDPVRHAVAHRLARARNPHRAGRRRGRAADLVGLLAQQHVEPFERRDQRGGHPAHAGTEHQDVDFPIPAHQDLGPPAGANAVGNFPLGAA